MNALPLLSTSPRPRKARIRYPNRFELAASSALNDGEQIVNTADVPTYYGRSATTRGADPVAEWRTYGAGGFGGNVAADTVTMTVGFPNVTVAKTAICDATDARAGTVAHVAQAEGSRRSVPIPMPCTPPVSQAPHEA